jgi:polyhydroxybutyrate depolymerase
LRGFFKGSDTSTAARAGVEAGTLLRPEGIRHFLKAVPSRAAAGKRPLVILLHGAGSSAAQVLGLSFPPSPLSLWLEIAEREQLLVIAPDGSKRRGERAWNDSYAGVTANPKTDDSALIGALIDRAIAEDGADPERVYLMGVSKGGMMAYRAATEIGPRLAAFSAVLAAMPVASNCGQPRTPLPTLFMAGTADPFIPYTGRKFLYQFPVFSSLAAPMTSVEESVAVWRGLAGLHGEPAIDAIPQRRPGAATRVTRYTWGADPAALQVRLLKIEGGGHAEPSALKRYPGLFSWFPGAQNGDIEAAEEAWAFFKDKRAAVLESALDDAAVDT